MPAYLFVYYDFSGVA